MSKIILCFSLLIPTLLNAQTDYLQMKNCSDLCFIPSEYSVDESINLHILQDDGLGIYDNNICLIKTINLPQQEFSYQSSRTRSRNVEGVERIALKRLEEITDIYISYAASENKDYAALSYEEKQILIANYDYHYYGVAVDIRNEGDFSLIVSKEDYGDKFFYYPEYRYEYPKSGILLDKEGKVYRFRASYDYRYSNWSDYKVNYDTIKVNNNILACHCIGSQGSSSNSFYVSSTLFNQDNILEYLRPIYTMVDAPIYTITGESDPESPVTNDGEYSNKKLAICGIEIVNENGAILSSISFDNKYENIGNYTLSGDYIFSVGKGVSILQLGENRFISFDTVNEEEGTTSIYKHFYKIDVTTSLVEIVNTPICVKVVQNNANSIEVYYKTDKVTNAELYSVDGLRCASQNIDVGTGSFRMDVNSRGTYILTISEGGTLVGTQKVLIR